jgi:hypothetical protein
MSLTSGLYRLARLSADAKAVGSGDTKKVTRRAKNKLVGQALGRGEGAGARIVLIDQEV